MTYEMLMQALFQLVSHVKDGLQTAADMKSIQDRGGPVPRDMIDKAHAIRKAAEAAMDAQK